MALARLRAIEPSAFDDSVLARFLPATIAAVAARRITIGVDLATNVRARMPDRHLPIADIREALTAQAFPR